MARRQQGEVLWKRLVLALLMEASTANAHVGNGGVSRESVLVDRQRKDQLAVLRALQRDPTASGEFKASTAGVAWPFSYQLK